MTMPSRGKWLIFLTYMAKKLSLLCALATIWLFVLCLFIGGSALCIVFSWFKVHIVSLYQCNGSTHSQLRIHLLVVTTTQKGAQSVPPNSFVQLYPLCPILLCTFTLYLYSLQSLCTVVQIYPVFVFAHLLVYRCTLHFTLSYSPSYILRLCKST